MAGAEHEPEFHWQSLFQDSAEPLFFLSRRCCLLFVNRAWEVLTGWSGAQVCGMVCSRRKSDNAGPMENLARTLCPPPGVMQGKSAQMRRPAPIPGPAQQYWDLTYSPLQGPDGVIGVLGRIQNVPASASCPALPEKIVARRERMTQRYRLDLIPTETFADRRLVAQARLASRSRVGVLLVGEPGSGKQWLARAIHYEGSARERAFVGLNCGRLPAPALIEFAFGEYGLLRRAEIGTLYLKDVAALPRDLQQRFAAFLTESLGSGPRVIGSCRLDPAEEVRSGRLHEDLYAGLGTLTIVVPPLRERRTCLRELVARLLDRAAAGEDGPVPTLAADAWDLIEAHAWPSNLRELYGVLAAARQRAGAAVIDASHLPAYLRQSVRVKDRQVRDDPLPRPLDQLLEEVERRLIVLALERHKGNKSKAARWLGIWRPRLLRRMEALGIQQSEVRDRDPEVRQEDEEVGPLPP